MEVLFGWEVRVEAKQFSYSSLELLSLVIIKWAGPVEKEARLVHCVLACSGSSLWRLILYVTHF